MGIFCLLLEFRHFDDPEGHCQDWSKFGEKFYVYMYIITASCVDVDTPSMIIVLSWLREVPFENGLVSCMYVLCVEACK